MGDVSIDGERLWDGLMALGAIGDRGDGAMMRVTGTEADRRARDHVVDRFEAAGLAVRVDHVGNIYARRAGREAHPPVLTGSHLDTVPAGGKFDGAAGVLAALEVIEAWDDAGVETDRPVEVVAFTEEEGTRFGTGLLGSLVATGGLDVEAALALEDDGGQTLEAVLEEIGYLGGADPVLGAVAAYLELHVEQGPRLEASGNRVGVVEAITGLCQLSVTYSGEANHAGATSMAHRRDGFAGVAEAALAIEALARELAATTDAVATVGRVEVVPNAANVIPGEVRFTVDLRDTDEATRLALRDDALDAIRSIAEGRGLALDLRELLDVAATPMDAGLVDELAAACASLDIAHMRLPSGGGHDAMNLAAIAPAGMLFVPSADGVSHSPQEHTDRADLTAGTRVLERVLRRRARVAG